MIIAIYIKSESADSYMYLWKNVTPEDVYQKLKKDLGYISPVGEYYHKLLDYTEEDEVELEYYLDQLCEESWSQQ